LFAVAFEMVLGLRLERSSKDAEQAVEEHWHHMAAFPLAIPLMAGPGAITATILLAGQAAYRPQWLAVLLFVIIVVMAACMASFAAAGRIGKLLGVTGNVVLTRLLGVILAALAVQYVVDGVRAAFAA
jgi:multiple antibiotic resistance protein